MPGFDAPSRCSCGSPIEFRWFGYPTAEAGLDLDTATDAFITSISPEGRVWNPYALRMVRAEFRDRIKTAARGELEPVDEVKPVDIRNPPPLYEIRWQGIHVTDQIDGQLHHTTALVRMYHSEPASIPEYFVGHHVHEKLVDVDDISGTQQAEIEIAKRFFDSGESSNWGIVCNDSAV